MMYDLVIKNAKMVNEGSIQEVDLGIAKGRIEKIASSITESAKDEINADGAFVAPGVIDDQVHFREPGFPHKANIQTESRAAVAGGVTSFMEMPNTNPQTVDFEQLEWKYARAADVSPANFSFYFGATNENLEFVKQVDPGNVCGVKIFMGSSTGNMLVDNEKILEEIFKNAPTLIATHCEDEATIRENRAFYKEKFGDDLKAEHHPLIRDAKGCYLSSSKAIELAKKTDARLHILHISTAIETELFRNDIPLVDKKITSEACVHHLFFNDSYYPEKGSLVQCNPAIKTEADRREIFAAMMDDRIDVIATDHAPHTWEEKSQAYPNTPSGLPLIQHPLNIMMDFVAKGDISIEKVIEKMCHAPAVLFRVKERGFIREGYFADLVLFDLDRKTDINKQNILYNCAWSPLEGMTLNGKILSTLVNGAIVFDHKSGVSSDTPGQRLQFTVN